MLTVPGSAFLAGDSVTFASITGGAGLSAGFQYWVINPSGTTFQLATSQGGTAINFTTDITAGSIILQSDEIRVWSAEYRDIFIPNGSLLFGGSGSGAGVTFPTGSSFQAVNPVTVTAAIGADKPSVDSDLSATTPDDVAHVPLRQTLLPRTFWKFYLTVAANSPTFLPAQVQDGDIIANNPPSTDE